jgi:hypothetical protein
VAFPEAIAKRRKLSKEFVGRCAEPVDYFRKRIAKLALENNVNMVNFGFYCYKLTVALFENQSLRKQY